MITIFIPLMTFLMLFFLLRSRSSLQTSPPPPPWTSAKHQYWQSLISNTTHHIFRHSVAFLPLQDLRYSHTHNKVNEIQHQFPSEASHGRLLCLKGDGTRGGSRNSYALAWPEALPQHTTFMKGLTFVSYSHQSYENMRHGLSAMVPFVAWYKVNNCSLLPSRWVLYHLGGLRLKMGLWVGLLMEATFNGPQKIERLYGPVCFEKAVVMRHNEDVMSREMMMDVYDLMRCKARMYCNVSMESGGMRLNERGLPVLGMTLLLRAGPRSFKNETIVTEMFGKECAKVDGCRFVAAHSNNLTFCEQVKLMSVTDILITPHGAQLSNMFLMERNSRVIEFFPKGWPKQGGSSQYVYQWMASRSGMKYQASWWDPSRDHHCPYPQDYQRCKFMQKSGGIGDNGTYFAEWARKVLAEAKTRKIEQASVKSTTTTTTSIHCACAQQAK